MILVNTDYISGKNLEMLSLVKGSTIQTKNIGRDISQGFKTLVGGELKAYTEMMNDARALATKRMVAEAEALGADAVVNIRYASSAVMQGAAEVIAYGTAVKFCLICSPKKVNFLLVNGITPRIYLKERTGQVRSLSVFRLSPAHRSLAKSSTSF